MNDLLVLAHLLSGPQHGYALKKQVGLITGQREMHNNLIYPLLRRFEKTGWITRRSAAGQRGQTREVYALTRKGKQELLRGLGQFTSKDAGSENAFRLRVGMFDILDTETRRRILSERDAWLAARQERVAHLAGVLNADQWGFEVLKMLGQQIRAERKWILRLKRKA
ncbi:MAG TPA: PadR family transcriptional regulator [Candidatus Methylomirabilis sp.]|nr:PadR family transcriptional regulator [Candidatus Methylomirabilis sp.]